MRIFSSKIPFLSYLQILLFGSIFFITGISVSSAYQYKNLDDGWMYNTDPMKFLSGTYTLGPVAIGYTSGAINPAYKLNVVGGYINTSSGFCISGNCISSWNSLLPNASNTGVTLRWTGNGWSDSNSGDILVNGINIGRGNGSIISNTVLGYSALSGNVSGHSNTAIGYGVLMSTTNGNYNTAIGFGALTSNIDGSGNVSIGYQALSNNLSGSYNTAGGFQSLGMNTLGSWNTAFGNSALILNTTGNYNTALGRDSLRNNRVGSSNIAIGHQSLFSNHTGSNSIAIGHQASFQTDISSPYPNIVIGYQSLYGGSFTALLNTAYNNVAIGYQTMYGTTGTPSTGYNNTTVGNGALNKNTSGRGNSTLGYRTLFSNTTGIYNTAIGDSALYSNTVGTYNTAIGRNALYENTTGDYNFALGFDALSMNDVGSYNTAIGSWALGSNTSGLNNTAIGGSALNMNDIGDDNVAIGESALMNNVIGHSNTAIGNWAGSAINGNSGVVDGFSNTFIGHYATTYTGNIENATAIGANSLVSASNTMVLGSVNGVNGATSDIQVVVGSGAASSGAYKFEVLGNVGITGFMNVLGNITTLTPTASGHVATKGYVDAVVSASAGVPNACISVFTGTNTLTGLCTGSYNMIWGMRGSGQTVTENTIHSDFGITPPQMWWPSSSPSQLGMANTLTYKGISISLGTDYRYINVNGWNYTPYILVNGNLAKGSGYQQTYDSTNGFINYPWGMAVCCK